MHVHYFCTYVIVYFYYDFTLHCAYNQLAHLPSQDIKSYPVHWIKVVEKLDDGAFNRKHMFQVVVVPSGPTIMPNTPPQVTLYLQASVSCFKGSVLSYIYM